MSSDFTTNSGSVFGHELHALRKEWYWFLLLGILLIVAGTAAIVSASVSVFTTLVFVIFVGLLLVVSGGAQIVGAFWAGRWSGFLLTLLAGLLYVVVGYMMITRPDVGEKALTLLLGAFFLIGGTFRIAASLAMRMHHWGWLLLNGVVTTLLGVIILSDLQKASLFFIGLYIGIEMLFNGWAWVMLAFGLRSLPERV